MGDSTTQIAPEQRHEGDILSVEHNNGDHTSPVAVSVEGSVANSDEGTSEKFTEPTEQFRIGSGPSRKRGGGKYHSGEQLAIPGRLPIEGEDDSQEEEDPETEPEENEVEDLEASESESSAESQSENENEERSLQLASKVELEAAANGHSDDETSPSSEYENLDQTIGFQINTPKGLQTPAHGFFTDAYIPATDRIPKTLAATPAFAFTPRLARGLGLGTITPLRKGSEPAGGADKVLESGTFESMSLDTYSLSVENQLLSGELEEKNQRIRKLEEMLANDMVEFSPEKRARTSSCSFSTHPSSECGCEEKFPQLQIAKLRCADLSKTNMDCSNKVSSRKGIIELLEEVTGDLDEQRLLTKEEKRRERRRRETRELRQFSAIDLSSLKNHLGKPTGLLAEVPEEAIGSPDNISNLTGTAPGAGKERKGGNDNTSNPQDIPNKPLARTNTDFKETVDRAEDDKVHVATDGVERSMSGKSTIDIDATSVSLSNQSARVRPRRISMPAISSTRRASSVPLSPNYDDGEDDGRRHSFSRSRHESTIIPHLQSKIESLEIKLEEMERALRLATAELKAERRARFAAEADRDFLETEQKFGVCCSRKQVQATPQRTQASAAVALPASASSNASLQLSGLRQVNWEDAPKRAMDLRKRAPAASQRSLRPMPSQPVVTSSGKEKRVLGQAAGNVILNSARGTSARGKGVTISGGIQKASTRNGGPVRTIRRMDAGSTAASKGPRR